MFNLEQSVLEWRRQMLADGIKAPIPLDELEAHLREEIERQMRAGFSAQFAFDVAAKQIGPARELKAEFSKQRRWRDILQTELVSKKADSKWFAVLLGLFTALLLLIAATVLTTSLGILEITSSDRASILAAIALSGLFAYSGFFGYKLFPVFRKDWIKAAIFIFAPALFILWVMVFGSRVNVGIEQLLVEAIWAVLVPWGVLIGLLSGLERSARKKSGMAPS